eukprot:13093154-Alexandrium_andersonii.AAC.1
MCIRDSLPRSIPPLPRSLHPLSSSSRALTPENDQGRAAGASCLPPVVHDARGPMGTTWCGAEAGAPEA